MMYDIIIIGAGASGGIFAYLIDEKYKVLLINGGYVKDKPCGGLLSPDARAALAKINITLPKNILVDPQIFSVSVVDYDNNITRNYVRSYLNFNRKKFDEWILNLSKNKVETINGIATKIEYKNNYKITVKTNKKEITYECKYLIGADGAGGLTRNFLYPNNQIEKLLSIQEWYKSADNKPIYSCIFDSSITKTYAWTIFKDGYLIYGGAYKNKKDFDKGKEKIVNLIPEKKEACLINNIKKLSDIKTGKNNSFLLGESAGFISPSSYEGISYAINTAIILAEIFNSSSKNLNKKYKIKTIGLKLKIFTKIIKAKIIENKYLRKIIMKSGVNSIKVINHEKINKNN